MKKIILALLSLYLITLGTLYLKQRSLLYHPDKEIHSLSFYNINNTSEITLTTSDGVKLEAWFRPPDDNMDMVVFLHGNAGSLDDRAEHLKILTKMGYGFIIPAWRGFGKSQGTPSIDGLYNDARSAISYILSKGYQLKNTIIIGESLGTGVAVEMALEYKFKGIFLITPYTSIADRAAEIYPFLFAHYLTKDNFNIIDKIHHVQQPLLIIHGTADNIVPYQHSERIFAQAQEPKKLIIYPGINHTNYDKEKIFLEMNNFLKNEATD